MSDALIAKAETRSAGLKENLAHAEANSDDWFAGMFADSWREQAAELDELVDALTAQRDLIAKLESERTDLLDALRIAVAAWDDHTTQDALRMIGLGDDISFPGMPRHIKSMADARRILNAVSLDTATSPEPRQPSRAGGR